jgi:hypothetical protein
MQISGHKTELVFERYNIVLERDVAETAKKLETYMRGRLTAAETPAPAPPPKTEKLQ